MAADEKPNERNLADDTGESQQPGSMRPLIVASALVVVVVLVAFRFVSELSMMREYGSDAQMPIWMAFVVVRIAFWLVIGGALAILISVLWARRWAVAIVLLLLVWSIAIIMSSLEYQIAARALADAADPGTPSERLRELVHFDGAQAGYELDNRLAANPGTPVEDLRVLYQRDQLGTKIVLAQNPNSPVDILETLSQHREIWVIRSLASNPNLPEHIRRELEDHDDEGVRQRLAQSQRD